MEGMSQSFVLLPHRRILSLKGPDTIALLERLVTNGVQDWTENETRYGALLTPQGKVLADYLAVRTQDGVLLDCDHTTVDDFAKRLKMFRLRSDVAIEVENDWSVLAQVGSGLPPSTSRDDIVYTDPRYTEPSQRIITATAPAQASLDAYHRDRIENGVPEMGTDFETASVFPSDINMDQLNGVDLKKGCFVGQEVVSRMHRRGKVRRRTIQIQGEALSRGQSLGNDEAVIGEVSSVSDDLGLAQIRTDRLDKLIKTDKPILVDGRVVSLTLPDWLKAEMGAMDS